MNITRSASMQWWDTLTSAISQTLKDKHYPGRGYMGQDQFKCIEHIWIQEVVHPWFDGNRSHESFERKNKLAWHYFNISDFRLLTNEERAMCYLKEHEGKEDDHLGNIDLVPATAIPQNPECPYCMVGIRNVGSGGTLCTYHQKLHGKQSDTPFQLLPVSKEDVQFVPPGTYKSKEEPFTCEQLVQMVHDSNVTIAYPSSHERELIEELLNALKFTRSMNLRFYPEDSLGIKVSDTVESAIIKAEEYLSGTK